MSYIDELPETETLFEDTESGIKSEYTTVLRESNTLVNYLLRDVERLKRELADERKHRAELQSKLELYYETGASNISRFTFRNYVLAALYRNETDEEWNQFQNSFSHNNIEINNKIYKWIDKNMTC
jgi:tRNA/tmRNA/rRNA uracil-C5-methylase (TrmA/RlmC/RlmD family)